MKRLVLALACVSLAALAAVLVWRRPAGASLGVGDPAPPLAQGRYVQGEQVSGFEKGKVYVVEMWATWCVPCVAAVPRLNELQARYADRGLVVIGQNVWEHDESKVEPFVQKMGERMQYRVALDDVPAGGGRGRMDETWMRAAGRETIPCTFIVNREGRIAWIGHPFEVDAPLAMVVQGNSL